MNNILKLSLVNLN